MMICRLIVLQLATMYLTGFLIINSLLNLLVSDEVFNTQSTLRSELDRVFGRDDGPSTAIRIKASQLIHLDSLAKETMRLHSFGTRGVMRKVMSDGVSTDDGQFLPRGTILSFLMHQPSQKYGICAEESLHFDPFRFSRAKACNGTTGDRKNPVVGSDSFITTSSDYLLFGHGRRACPGRSFVNIEFKLMIAYALRHYDFKFVNNTKPEELRYRYVAETLRPPRNVEILIKKRQL
jgi:cytochrome P450